MKRHRIFFLVALLQAHFSIFPAIFDRTKPYTLTRNEWFPETAFFRSLYARKHLAMNAFPVKAEISGYFLHEPFWDTRQSITAASGLQYFAPLPKKCDPKGEDINDIGQFSMSMLETRGRAKLYGPLVLGAESFGLIEFDFVGSGPLVARSRARLAYMKLTWKEQSTTLWAGQYFHPIRLAHLDLDPKVISRNRGSPIHPNTRSPQVRFTKGWDNNFNIVLTAVAQLEDPSPGPDGPSSTYIRRSMMPIFNAQFWIGPLSTEHVIGVGFDIKRIMPRLVTDRCLVTRETLTSVAFDAYAKLTAKPLSIRTQFVWGQNTPDYGMLGGYVVKTIDPITDRRTYANMNVMSYWIDFNLDKKIAPGLFGGYSHNFGTNTPVIPCIINCEGKKESLIFTKGLADPIIKYMAKITPRIRFHYKPMVFGAELEWTRVGYGMLNQSGHIEQVVPVSNVRCILASYFFF